MEKRILFSMILILVGYTGDYTYAQNRFVAKAESLNTAAVNAYRMEDYSAAKDLYNRAAVIFLELDDLQNHLISKIESVNMLIDMNDVNQAKEAFEYLNDTVSAVDDSKVNFKYHSSLAYLEFES